MTSRVYKSAAKQKSKHAGPSNLTSEVVAGKRKGKRSPPRNTKSDGTKILAQSRCSISNDHLNKSAPFSPRDQLAITYCACAVNDHLSSTRAHLIRPRDQLAITYCACAVSCNGVCRMEMCNGNMQNGNRQW